jgi:hypothetical protein
LDTPILNETEWKKLDRFINTLVEVDGYLGQSNHYGTTIMLLLSELSSKANLIDPVER